MIPITMVLTNSLHSNPTFAALLLASSQPCDFISDALLTDRDVVKNGNQSTVTLQLSPSYSMTPEKPALLRNQQIASRLNDNGNMEAWKPGLQKNRPPNGLSQA